MGASPIMNNASEHVKKQMRVLLICIIFLACAIFRVYGTHYTRDEYLRKISVCDVVYGIPLHQLGNVRSFLTCAVKCMNTEPCQSLTHDPVTKLCKFNREPWSNPPTSGCLGDSVFYIEKQAASALSTTTATTTSINQPSTPVSGTPTSQPSTPVSGTPTSQPSTPVSGTPTSQPSTPVSGTPTSQPSTPVSGTPNGQPSTPVSGTPTSLPSTSASVTSINQPSTPVSVTSTSQPSTPVSVTSTSLPSTPVSDTPTSQTSTPVSGTPTSQPSTPVSVTSTSLPSTPVSVTSISLPSTPASVTSTTTAALPVCATACTIPVNNTRLCDGGGAGVCDPAQGRLEVYYNNVWGTVCDDFFYQSHQRELGNVACTMLGYTAGTTYIEAQFGEGLGTIWLDDVECMGTETSLFQCPHNGWGSHNCWHSEDVGVVCY